LYKFAHQKSTNTTDAKASGTWLDIQKLALNDSATSDKEIKILVLKAQRLSIKLPVVRKAAADVVISDENGVELFSLEEGQTVVCDIVSQTYSSLPSLFHGSSRTMSQSTCAHQPDHHRTASRHEG
jgi:hypothetical protein